jgi:ribonuclease HI
MYLIFDGGNGASVDKMAYGSFKIDNKPIYRVEFGVGYTNNEAEYKTLIYALEHIIERYNAGDITLTIEGDSELVRSQVGTYEYGPYYELTDKIISKDTVVLSTTFARDIMWNGWKVNKPHLLPLRDKARVLLLQFKGYTYNHIPRKDVVKALGH